MELKNKYRSLLRIRLNRKNKKRLKNDTVSIIASNCVGGVITHELGLRFDSPTVNLYFEPADYLKFLVNLQHYIVHCTLIHDERESFARHYPVGILDDIKIYFVHYQSFENAKQKWEERCKRIHWDKIYVIMVQRDGCTDEMIREFDNLTYKHKIIFTAKEEHQIVSSYYIPDSEQKNGEVKDLCSFKGKFTGKRLIDDFDYVGFLNK